jgi:diguanylate cyclase (GGDEF)-like protein
MLATRLELIRDEAGLPVSVSGVARDVTELDGLQRQVRDLGHELQNLRRRDRRRDREMNALLTAARVLNSELEIDQLLQHVIESAAAQIAAESGFVGLLDEGALTLRWYWRSTGASWVDLEGPGVERGVAEIILDTRRPYFCANAEEDPNTDKEFTKRFGIRTMLVFPIFSQESELIGAMALHNDPRPGGAPTDADDVALDPSDTRFLEGLADVASAAIQQSRLFEKVRLQAETDPLTGLFNRRAFDERFDSEIERAARFNRTFALMLLDIDHLKRINDTYGHPIGDAAICTVADVLQSRLRRHDFAARIGGEEFAVLVVEGRSDTAASVARSLLESLRKRDVPRAGHITASLGVAIFPEDAGTKDELFRVADNALYGAKNSGRNRVMLWRDMETGDVPNPS